MVLTLGGGASADAGNLPGGATLMFDGPYIKENGGNYRAPSDRIARYHYFNYAHCACSKAGKGKETMFAYQLTSNMPIVASLSAEFWVGTSCDQEAEREDASMCRRLDAPVVDNIGSVAAGKTKLEFSLYDVIAPGSSASTLSFRDLAFAREELQYLRAFLASARADLWIAHARYRAAEMDTLFLCERPPRHKR